MFAYLLENLKIDASAAKQAWASVFVLMVQPLRTQGGTGSTVALWLCVRWASIC